MEVSEEVDYKVLLEFLMPAEIAQISDIICKKIEDFCRDKFDEFITAKAIFETNRKNIDQKFVELNKNYEAQKEDLKLCLEKLDLTEKFVSELQSQLNESRNDFYRLQESIKRLEKENVELRIHKDEFSDENNLLHSQIERRDSELERLKKELNLLESQLQAAINAKCQAFDKMEELRSQEMSLDFKEKRLDQERLLLSQQMTSLEEELSKRTNELQSTRSEASARALLTQTRLSQCEEELKIASETVNQMREANSTLQCRCEEFTQKLEDQRNHELTMHASYREEVIAQTRLADLYKGMAEEANSKADEYSNAVKELQNLLETATEQYGMIESKYNQSILNYNQETVEKKKQIDNLTKELDLANELLKTIKQERLDQSVEQLAPTAAVASRILKKGLSLTQIYTQLVEVTNELSLEKEEHEKLKSQMVIILRELQDKGPILQQQREDYEIAIANVTSLTRRLDELLAENCHLQEDADEAKRLVNHHSRESQRLKSELADLARQVCYLLKEVQENRTGNSLPADDITIMETDELASSYIISKKLVTFKDIESLQENNQKLLSIVRALSSKQEEIEKATDQINSGEMKEKLDRYIEQLSDMQTAQDRQAKMLEGLLKQRDMYKNMYQQCLNQTSNINNEARELLSSKHQDFGSTEESSQMSHKYEISNDEIKNYLEKIQMFETKYNQVNRDFEIYKKEKAANEDMLNSEIERLRKDSERNSTDSCRLKILLDTANERFNLLQGNVSAYKSQIKILEDKCNNYSTTIGKHEQSIMLLKDETLAAQSSLSKAEVLLENLRHERQLLRDSEGRLLKEREVLQRERHTHALLKTDIESIKASLERAQAEGQLRNEQRLDDATRECCALRRRLQEEQDRFRELSLRLERQVSTIQERLTEEKNLVKRIQSELDASRLAEQEYIKRIEEVNCKLKQASSHTISKPITGDDQVSKKMKELEVQLSNSQIEVKSLIDQLRAARVQSQQYCDIAESAESQLRDTTDQFNKIKTELQNSLTASQQEVESLKAKVKHLEAEIMRISNGQQESDVELKEKEADTEQKLTEIKKLKRELEAVKDELKNTTAAVTLAEDKYARELVLHSNDLQMLTKLKDESQKSGSIITELRQQLQLVNETVTVEKSMSQEREKRFLLEIQELQKNIHDLDQQNILLHNQLQEFSERTAIIQSQQQINSERQSPNTSVDFNRSYNDEDSKSSEQLLQVLKYLRREKDLAIAKFEVLKSENSRLKSQIDLAEKRTDEIKELLERERENSEINVVTTSKHSELLRKIETLNAITDSNRILREERNSLNKEIHDLTDRLNALNEEVVPLREKSRDLETKYEALIQENNSLKGEAMRWRQRANTLVERANKASPEDWRRLQTERENLSKLLTSERETYTKRTEELNNLKSEKNRLEELLNQAQHQLKLEEERVFKTTESVRKLDQDLNECIKDSNEKAKDLITMKKDLLDKDTMLTDIKNKEIQIRKIAKKYKTQYEELAKSMEEKSRVIDNQNQQTGGESIINEENSKVAFERENQLREEGRLELRNINVELTTKVDDLNQQLLVMQSESENLKKEIEIINKASIEKEERAKQVLKGARTKIMQLTEYKKLCEKELHDLKEKLDSSTNDCESNVTEYEARLIALKSQMEGRILRLEHERSELQAEKEALLQRTTQLQRQLAGQSNLGIGVSEPPTANIKPMSARTETPLASIRPMSVVVQSRTAAVLPTTASSPLLLTSQQSQQQLVHTTETSSPTSSHVDYQPASTSRQLLVQPQLSESAESTQREEPEVLESQSAQQQLQQCQQTVALVIPRIEQQQNQQQNLQTLPNDQQQTIPSSSTQSVSTSHAPTGHKRARALDSLTSATSLNDNLDISRQDQICSPKSKRSRQQELVPSTPASASDIEYQVPTSSQRDQDEEGEDGCIVVVACDEGGGTHQTQEEEEFDNDAYEEIEEEDITYSVGVEGDNNEVEIIIEDESTNVEIPRQIQAGISINQQQQSEAISSAGPTGEPSAFTTRSTRGIAPMPRQTQQHLLLTQQSYEDGGDDCIVPSTPTLFVPRRNDGFGEAINSPQVPQTRFTFGDPSTSTSICTAQSHITPSVSGTRTMFSTAGSVLAQVVQEGMDDTRVDLTQLEESCSGRSVPTTPKQVSPIAELSGNLSIRISDTHDSLRTTTESQTTNHESTDENIMSVTAEPCSEEQDDNHTETIIDSEIATIAHDNNLEIHKSSEDPGGSGIIGGEDVLDADTETCEESSEDTIDQDSKENREAEASPSSNTRQRTMAAAAAAAGSASTVRGATARRSTRTSFRTARGTRPTPIVWDSQSSLRGQSIVRGHTTRSSPGETTRLRGARGRRLRSKYPYNY